MKIIRRLLAGFLVATSFIILQLPANAQQTETKQDVHNVEKSAEQEEETVIYNTQSHKYHTPDCASAKRCTKNCISIKREEAIKRDGVPCKICGG